MKVSLSFAFLVFIVYSFIGWLSEVAYCYVVVERKLVNRGFLHGPLCPIYGFGGLIVIYLLAPFQGNLPLLFAMAVIWTTVLEYLTSWALEAVFSTKWWDYSDLRFNLHGRVCLRNSLLFGAMGVLAVHFVHPRVIAFLSLFPEATLDTFAVAVAAVLAVDLVLTLKTLIHIGERLVALKELTERLRESVGLDAWFNERDLRGSLARLRDLSLSDASGVLARLAAKLEESLAHTGETLRIFRAFPTMKNPRLSLQLDVFRILGGRRKPRAGEAETETPGIDAFSTGFAERFGFYRFFWIFLVAGFFGVMIESLWCVVTRGYLEHRAGLLFAPFNPVYGFGAVIMSAVFTRREKSRDLRVFVDNVLIGGAFEYLASLAQELVFHSVSWEYSAMRFNVNVRTNVLYALGWGFLGLLWVREACPALSRIVARVPVRLGKALSIVLFSLLLADGIVSSVAVWRWSSRRDGVPAANAVTRLVDERFPDAFMRERYPNMVFVDPDVPDR
jgi:uncharacterized membrane protein